MSHSETVGPVQVLLVEDNPGDALLATEHLSACEGPERFEVHRVETVDEAQARLADSHFDVCLLDANLPDGSWRDLMDGCQRIALPVVVLTGAADPTEGRAAVAAGAQDWLSKRDASPALLSRTLAYALARSRLGAAVAREHQHLRRLFAVLPEGVLVVDEAGIARYANPAANRLWGGESLEARAVGVFRPGPTVIELLGSDGKLRRAEIRRTEIAVENGFVVLARDVTEETRASDLEARLVRAEQLASVGRLAAGVAHEINNPAAAVVGALELAREDLAAWKRISADPAAAESVEQIDSWLASSLEGVQRISEVVAELQSYGRAASEQLRAVSLNEVVRRACKILGGPLRSIKVELDLGQSPELVGYRGKLVQVVTNLLCNALDALRGNRDATIRITTRVELDHAVLAIEDTGVGVPEQLKTRVFEPFFTTKDAEHGTGLGLALAQKIIREHRGEIRLESEAGIGSRFEIRLPLDTGLAIPRPAPSTPAPVSPDRSSRILIVEDEVTLAGCFAAILERRGEVTVVHDGVAALDAARGAGQPFDVVVCDLMMPRLSGRVFFEQLVAEHPEYEQRFVFVTGGACTPELQAFCDNLDAPALFKPFEAQALRKAADDVLRRSRRNAGRPRMRLVSPS